MYIVAQPRAHPSRNACCQDQSGKDLTAVEFRRIMGSKLVSRFRKLSKELL